jgi:hypothetical protein
MNTHVIHPASNPSIERMFQRPLRALGAHRRRQAPLNRSGQLNVNAAHSIASTMPGQPSVRPDISGTAPASPRRNRRSARGNYTNKSNNHEGHLRPEPPRHSAWATELQPQHQRPGNKQDSQSASTDPAKEPFQKP